ncbi:Uncharacterized protein TCM_038537 [Theobroma cacao]|uniref:Uncharacterized protein n=1 Tax=Theobroma cacao TaxID=3641 RepID=A0A061GQA3_THECC|nr:Uncharacterized protein TCM_038537 [Theobroma cacao]
MLNMDSSTNGFWMSSGSDLQADVAECCSLGENYLERLFTLNFDVCCPYTFKTENHQSIESPNAIAEKQPCNGSCPGMSSSDIQTLGRGEMVKHMVYQHCRSSSVSVQIKWLLGSPSG